MIISLAVVFGGILAFNVIKGLLLRHYFASYKPPAVSVSSVVATVRNWYPNLRAVGNFEAIDGVEINTEVPGKITTIHFKSGQFVKKDEPLLDLDDSVEQATLQFNLSALTLATLDHQRQVELFKHGATPKASVDAAQAKLQQAQASVDKTHAEINQKHLKAPFSGRLGIRQVNLGQYISPGQTDIVTLQSLDPLYLKFHVPEQYISHLHKDQTIIFSVEQNKNFLFEGKVTAISSKVDTKMHNIELQAKLLNCPTSALLTPDKSPLVKLKKLPFNTKPLVQCSTEMNLQNKITEYNFVPGMFAAISIELPPIANAVVLPSTAISYSLYGNSVYVIEKDPNDIEILRARRVFVKTGDQKDNYIVIHSGIKEGQLVVGSGELKLQNGTEVVINNAVHLDETASLTKIGQ